MSHEEIFDRQSKILIGPGGRFVEMRIIENTSPNLRTGLLSITSIFRTEPLRILLNDAYRQIGRVLDEFACDAAHEQVLSLVNPATSQ